MKRLAWVLGIAGVALGVLIWIAAHNSEPSNPPEAVASMPASSLTPVDPAEQVRDTQLPEPEAGAAVRILTENAAPGRSPDSVDGFVARLSDGTPLRCTVSVLVDDDRLKERAILGQTHTDGETGRFTFGADVAARDPLWLQLVWDQTEGTYDGAPGRKLWSQEVPLPPRAERTTLRLVLDTGWIAHGRVVTPEGAPVQGAWVSNAASAARSGADGRFSLRDLDPTAETLTLKIRLPGHLPASAVVAPPPVTREKDISDLVVGPTDPNAPVPPAR